MKKKSTLVAFLMLAALFSSRADCLVSSFHVDNIVLKNFQAIQVVAGAKVIWEFTSEEHDVTCNLEKSTDGINFVTLSTIQLSSTREQALHSYIDRTASKQSFYRLRITKQSYIPFISPIVSLNILQAPAAVRDPLDKGPQLKGFFEELSMQNDVLCVRLVDIGGQAKIKQYLKGVELERVFRSSFSHLPAGYYVLNINDTHNRNLLNKCIYKF